MTNPTIIGLLIVVVSILIPVAIMLRDRKERRNRYGFPRSRRR